MTFKLRIPGRVEVDAPQPANPANPLIGRDPEADAANDGGANVTTTGRISRLAGLAAPATCADDHEAKVERSAIISADGVPYWDADNLAGLPAWTDAEITTFERRVARSIWLGCPDAKGRAERLLHRDRDADDRHLCVECAHARAGRRCAKDWAFMEERLQRCPSFKEAKL